MPVRHPANTDDRNAGFNPSSDNSHQPVSGSVRSGNEKGFSRHAFDTAEHSLAFCYVAPMVLAPTDLALVDFESLVTTTDPFKAVLPCTKYGLTALGPISHRS
jgi:hypothetical protein